MRVCVGIVKEIVGDLLFHHRDSDLDDSVHSLGASQGIQQQNMYDTRAAIDATDAIPRLLCSWPLGIDCSHCT